MVVLPVHHLIINSWDHRVLLILVPMGRRPECILPCHHTVLWGHMDPLTALRPHMVQWDLIVHLHLWTEWIQGKFIKF